MSARESLRVTIAAVQLFKMPIIGNKDHGWPKLPNFIIDNILKEKSNLSS